MPWLPSSTGGETVITEVKALVTAKDVTSDSEPEGRQTKQTNQRLGKHDPKTRNGGGHRKTGGRGLGGHSVGGGDGDDGLEEPQKPGQAVLACHQALQREASHRYHRKPAVVQLVLSGMEAVSVNHCVLLLSAEQCHMRGGKGPGPVRGGVVQFQKRRNKQTLNSRFSSVKIHNTS